jgi:hypothetical protein
MARLDAFTRAIEIRRQPDADIDATIAHERAVSPTHGGRTVMDDRVRRPARSRGQLELFDRSRT